MHIAVAATPALPRPVTRRGRRRPVSALAGALVWALFGTWGAGTCAAQPQSAPVPPPPQLQAEVPVPAAAAAPASAASAPARAASPRTNVVVIEDDEVRIEETRVRGQTQRIVVQSKLPGVRPYEIIVSPGGKDSSQDRGAAGQRAWSLFAF